MLDVMTTDELLSMEPPEWLIEDFVAERSTTMIYGPWGLGKSFLVLDMVLTATHRSEWMGGKQIKRPLKTLYVVAEGAAWWGQRVQAYKQHKGEFDEDLVYWIPRPVNLWTPGKETGDLPALRETLERYQPDILVFDTWVRCTSAFGMNEDKATDTAVVIRNLDEIRDTYGVTPIIVHHPTKTGNFRGSGNLGASVERIIELKEVKDAPSCVDVADEKGNHIQPMETFRCRFESVDIAGDGKSAVLVYDGAVVDGPREANWERMLVAIQGIFPVGTQVTYADLGRVTDVKTGSLNKTVQTLVQKGYLLKNADGSYRVQ